MARTKPQSFAELVKSKLAASTGAASGAPANASAAPVAPGPAVAPAEAGSAETRPVEAMPVARAPVAQAPLTQAPLTQPPPVASPGAAGRVVGDALAGAPLGPAQTDRRVDEPPAPEASRPLRRRSGVLGHQAFELGSIADASQRLERVLADYEGATPVKLLDPRSVRLSEMANRDASHWESEEFASLKAAILATRGNTQAIQVYRLPRPEGDAAYVLASGSRRLRACLDHALPVKAEILGDLDEQALWTHMTAENLEREDLSAYEQGLHFKRALDARWFSTQEQIAARFGISTAKVSRALSVASLPEPVLRAFGSPVEISADWMPDLNRALKTDRAAVLRRAAAIVQMQPRPPAARALRLLVGDEPVQVRPAAATIAPAASTIVLKEGRRQAKLITRGASLVLDLTRSGLGPERLERLRAEIGQRLEQVLKEES